MTFFKQNYVNALANGDVVASMAWSGDIYQENAIGAPEGLQFATPHDGGLLWTDNMVIPAGALHPVDAITLMDFVYQPAIAALITEFVAYVTPVPEARNQILADADATAEPGRAGEAAGARRQPAGVPPGGGGGGAAHLSRAEDR